jgi:hypothetical protein
MARPVLFLLIVTLALWALVDVAQTPVERVQRLSKSVWSFVVLIPVIGAVAWFVEGRKPAAPTGPPARPTRPLAPDDDPEFLRRLRDRKHPDGTP